jgi:hypothetical protein
MKPALSLLLILPARNVAAGLRKCGMTRLRDQSFFILPLVVMQRFSIASNVSERGEISGGNLGGNPRSKQVVGMVVGRT